jgi:hypothetical protein
LGALSARIEKLATGATSSSAALSAAHLMVPAGNLKVLMIVPEQSLAPGHYRVVLHSNTAPSVSDLSGHSLLLGIPSGGGDALISTFDVEAQP